jgi:hypothetical protein
MLNYKKPPTLKEWTIVYFDPVKKHQAHKFSGGFWYPWTKLKVGDYFFVHWKDDDRRSLPRILRTDWNQVQKRVKWIPDLINWKMEVHGTVVDGKLVVKARRIE